jgi:acyl-CoA hydrolase/GNAT superfamily N-acetyltransferase
LQPAPLTIPGSGSRQVRTVSSGRSTYKIVPPEVAIDHIRPGMSIFLGTAVAEPRTIVRQLMVSRARKLEDLELIQLVSLGDAISLQRLHSRNFRLRTFFSGWAAREAIEAGQVDMIPSQFAKIPDLIKSGQVPIDVAVLQITPPDEDGFCSLGIAVDVGREAMEQAEIVVGEINSLIPRTFGDTYVHLSEFDFLVESTEPPIYFSRWPVNRAWERVAANVSLLIDDGSCLAFSIGPLFEALAGHLVKKRHLGIHSPFFTDPLMDLMKSGAITNRRKDSYRGKSLTSYAFGSPAMLKWLDHNPLVEFQRISKVFNPLIIGRNPNFVTIVAGRKVDLYGRIGLHIGKGSVATGPAEVMDFLRGADLSEGGRSVFALTSRDPAGHPNVELSIADRPNQFGAFESVSAVATEYGVAYLAGRSVRERAQALIEIAHPDDREELVKRAKAERILYADQIFLADSGRLYPTNIIETYTAAGGLKFRFRPIKPSDEEGMRHLFYRFSDETVYRRYFASIRSMPHEKMQAYVNVDWRRIMSIVGLLGEEGRGQIVAEGRFIQIPGAAMAEIVFVVDEKFQRLGIATFLFQLLVRLARQRGIQTLVAEVLHSNIGTVMKVLRKGRLPVTSRLSDSEYHIEISLSEASKPSALRSNRPRHGRQNDASPSGSPNMPIDRLRHK